MKDVRGLVRGGGSLGASGLEALRHRPKLFPESVDHEEIVGGCVAPGADEGENLVQRAGVDGMGVDNRRTAAYTNSPWAG